MEIAAASRPHPHETVCGDVAVVVRGDGRAVVAVIDGLGHGAEARVAADAARQAILEAPHLAPAAMLERCHLASRGTRGSAMGVMQLVEPGKGLYAGVGNVAVGARSQVPIHVISHAGVVGHKMRRVHEYAFGFHPGDLICLSSDGLVTALTLEGVDAGVLGAAAEGLVARYGRPNDDATVVLVSC
jgi:hypothetical protein